MQGAVPVAGSGVLAEPIPVCPLDVREEHPFRNDRWHGDEVLARDRAREDP